MKDGRYMLKGEEHTGCGMNISCFVFLDTSRRGKETEKLPIKEGRKEVW
jgi:hypothetical protein